MTDAIVPKPLPSAATPGATSIQTSLTQRAFWVSTTVYAGLVALCALAGYWLMFSQFAVYDDEGFFDYSLHLFSTGHALYTQVFSDYGPFYYEVFGALFAILGHTVTTDSGRLIQLVLWIATTLAMGLIAHRLSGRLAIGVAALATTFVLLTGSTSEPMHASMLNDFLLTVLVGTAAFGMQRRTSATLMVIGALTGALLLTKINIGGYAIVAVAFAAVLAGGWLGRWRAARVVVIIALVLVGPVVMIGKLGDGWAENYALLAALSAGSVALVAVPARLSYAPGDGSGTWALWLLGGFFAMVVAVVAVAVSLGTRIGDLVNDILIVPSHQGSVLVEPITLGQVVVWWSLGLVGVAWLWSIRFRASEGDPPWWDGALRVLAGVTILLSLGGQAIFSIAPNAAFSLAMPLAWVAAVPARSDAVTAQRRMLRLLLPAIAVSQALIAYPVAGTQIGYGSILFVPCAAVCLGDGCSLLQRFGGRRRDSVGLTPGRACAALLSVLAVGCTWQFVIQPLSVNQGQYHANARLTVPGATRLRLSAGQGTPIDAVVAGIHAHGCKAMLGFPGLYSFDIWSGVPYVTPQTGEQPYWRLLSYQQQYEVLQRALRTPDLCVIRDDGLGDGYGGQPQRSPIVKYIDADFIPAITVNPYELEVRRPPAHRPRRGR